MELITEKPVKQFDTSAIAKGNLIYAKHSSWDAGKSGFVTGAVSYTHLTLPTKLEV